MADLYPEMQTTGVEVNPRLRTGTQGPNPWPGAAKPQSDNSPELDMVGPGGGGFGGLVGGNEDGTRDDGTIDPQTPESIMDGFKTELAIYASKRFMWYKQGRRVLEQEMVDALRQERGEYSADELANIRAIPNRSEVFVRITASVCAGAKSLIMQIVAAGEEAFPYTIKPTPDPTMRGIDKKAIQDVVTQAASQIQDPEQKAAFLESHDFAAMIDKKYKIALQANDAMKIEMDDQLDEMNWDQEFMSGVDYLKTYGTMIVQGPLTVARRPSKWIKDSSGDWKLAMSRHRAEYTDADGEVNHDLRPEFRVLDNLRVYRDPAAISQKNMSGVIVHHVKNRTQLGDLRYTVGFDAQAIDYLLDLFSERGNWVPEWWETAIEDANNTRSQHDNFSVYEHWEYMSGHILRKYGVDVSDDQLNDTLLVNIWWCGNTVIKTTISNMCPAVLPFFFIPYDTVIGRVEGRGVPMQMSDSQGIYNAAERAIIDNMAYSVGPMVGLDRSRLHDRVGTIEMHPMKVFEFDDTEGLTGGLPIEFFQAQSNIHNMVELQQQTRLHIQKETNLPDFAMGIPGSAAHNRTAEGLSMQRDQALGFIRAVIGNLDTYGTGPMMTALYNWNMTFNPNPEIKGDMDVVAKGVDGAMAKEVMSQRLGTIMQQLGEDLKYVIDGSKLVDRWVDSMGLKGEGITRSSEDALKMKQADEAQQAKNAQNVAEAGHRVQPQIPPLNAAIQMLDKTPPTYPMYGPTYQLVLKLMGVDQDPVLGPQFEAAIKSVNAVNATQAGASMAEGDRQALTSDIAGSQALLHHHTGGIVGPDGSITPAPPPGQTPAAGPPNPGGLPAPALGPPPAPPAFSQQGGFRDRGTPPGA